MKRILHILAPLLLLAACQVKPAHPDAQNTPTKGELSFLLQYDGKLPSDVGLLRNQVVQRRLGNLMKDSFQLFLQRSKYERPIQVSEQQQWLVAEFYSDSDRAMPSAQVTFDVANDAVWVEYLSGDSIIEYTDHKELQKPGMPAD